MLHIVGRADYSYPYMYTISNGTITIHRYNGSDVTLTIPDTINDFPVTSIGPDTFYGSDSLTSVTIGTNVTSIGHQAFWMAANLTTITIDVSNPVYSCRWGVIR